MLRGVLCSTVLFLPAGFLAMVPPTAKAGYLGPVAVAAAADGKTLFVAAADANQGICPFCLIA